MPQAKNDNGAIAGFIFLGAMLIVALITFLKETLPQIFIVLSVISFLAFIGWVIYGVKEDEMSIGMLLPLALGVVFFLIAIASYNAGVALEESAIGQMAIDINKAGTGIEEDISETMELAMSEAVDSSCATLDEESCVLLGNFAETAQTAQEIFDKANTFRNLAHNIQKVTP